MHKSVHIDGTKIRDWSSFHDYFSKVFGFPAFYGRNLDAWIDCMTSLDASDEGMTTVHVAPGDVLVLCVDAVVDFRRSCQEIYNALIECVAFVNYRRMETGQPPVLVIAFANDK